VENQAHNDCKALKQGTVETNRGTRDTVISRQANVSSSLGVYSPSLCEQGLLLAMEVMRVCPEDNKSAAVWTLQTCLLQLLWHCCEGRKPVLPQAGRCRVAVPLWDQLTWRIRLNRGALAWLRACFLWAKQIVQKPGWITAEIVQVLLAVLLILPPKPAQELGSTRAFKENFVFMSCWIGHSR